MHLVSDDISFTTSTGNYAWTYPTDTPDEWCGVEAGGMAPTDPYVFENIEHLFLIDETEFTLDWGDNSPDKVEVIGWENAVFQDVEHAGDYQDTYLELTDWKVVLKPDHVYSIGARWLESEEEKVSHGSASYYIVTESTAALPAYIYTGDDPVVGAIINTLLTDGHADDNARLVDNHQIFVVSHSLNGDKVAGLVGDVQGLHALGATVGDAVVLDVGTLAKALF